ncbi:uncharacterized protein LOC119555826 [Drosophila subpulchrella]|uniref:uncharacterized protein LOC119555826 n=1 Tax=Drosophila subpulchrella TaxID=1486046 RepID=UPI0018A17D6B|nr:uncharacterized protein LOC119555826 [Drosophila subpulchrella]
MMNSCRKVCDIFYDVNSVHHSRPSVTSRDPLHSALINVGRNMSDEELINKLKASGRYMTAVGTDWLPITMKSQISDKFVKTGAAPKAMPESRAQPEAPKQVPEKISNWRERKTTNWREEKTSNWREQKITNWRDRPGGQQPGSSSYNAK